MTSIRVGYEINMRKKKQILIDVNSTFSQNLFLLITLFLIPCCI